MSLRRMEPQRPRLTRWEIEEQERIEAEKEWQAKSSEAKAEDLMNLAETQMQALFGDDATEREEWEALFKKSALKPEYRLLHETGTEKKERFCLLPNHYSTHICFEVACPKCRRISYADYEPDSIGVIGPAEKASVCCHCGHAFMTFTEGLKTLKYIKENKISIATIAKWLFWLVIGIFMIYSFTRKI